VVRYRALLLDQKGAPFSLVVESYTGALLDFGSPPPAGGGEPPKGWRGAAAEISPSQPPPGLRPYSPQEGERFSR